MIFKNSNLEVLMDTEGNISIKHHTGAEVLILANNSIGIKVLTDDTIKSFDSTYLNSILVENVK